MKVLIINTSPRKSFTTSKYLSNILKFWLTGNKVETITLKSIVEYKKIIEKLPDVDTVVFATPVYVDSIPSTTLEHLVMLQKHVIQHNLKFNVYGLVNCGFYEGHQTESALKTFEFWCKHAKLNWCGGLGVGGGVMVGFIRTLPWIGFVMEAIIVGIISIVGIFSDNPNYYAEFFSHYWYPSLVIQFGLWLFWTMGVFVNIFKLSRYIKKRKDHKIKFTGLWFCPRWLFIALASLYWFFRAILLHFKWPWQLFKKIPGDTHISNV
ncbi:MAG: hypothetical protein ACRC4M_02845 [Mycoplasma sp.]